MNPSRRAKQGIAIAVVLAAGVAVGGTAYALTPGSAPATAQVAPGNPKPDLSKVKPGVLTPVGKVTVHYSGTTAPGTTTAAK